MTEKVRRLKMHTRLDISGGEGSEHYSYVIRVPGGLLYKVSRYKAVCSRCFVPFTDFYEED
jgi:hypothetical protein